jgi:hypothetical protein
MIYLHASHQCVYLLKGLPRNGARSPSLLNGAAIGRSQTAHRAHVNGSRGNQGGDHASMADTESNEGYSEQESLTSVE